MFGGALIAIGTLLNHVGGLHEVIRAVPQLTTHEGYFLHGFEASGVAKWKESHQLAAMRSEEHTSELQSRLHLVCRLLLEKKKGTVSSVTLCDPQCSLLPHIL